MKLSEYNPTLTEWRSFDNAQRKKVVEFFEDYLCPDFARRMHWGNDQDNLKPRGLKGRARFSTLEDFSENAIGYYPNDMMGGLVAITACHSPVRFHIAHVEEIPAEGPSFPSLDGQVYHDEKSQEEADERFRKAMKPIIEFAAKKNGISIQEVEDGFRAKPGNKEYAMVRGNERMTGFCSLESAVSQAKDITRMMFGGHFPNMDFPDELANLDYRKDYHIEIPKLDYIEARMQFSDLWHLTDDLPFYDKLVNGDENTEFIKLLESI